MVVVGIVIHYATKSGSQAPKEQQKAVGSMNLGLVNGAKQQQVLHRLGRPTSKQGRCWIYRTNAGRYNGTYVGKYIDAVRFCFIGGVVSDIEDHWIAVTNLPPSWRAPVVFSSGTPSPP